MVEKKNKTYFQIEAKKPAQPLISRLLNKCHLQDYKRIIVHKMKKTGARTDTSPSDLIKIKRYETVEIEKQAYRTLNRINEAVSWLRCRFINHLGHLRLNR